MANALIQTDVKIMETLSEVTGHSTVKFPVGVNDQGDTQYQPGYILTGSSEAPEYHFDNEKNQRCAVPKHRVEEKLNPAPVKAGK
jgi:hypothetical protein